MEGHPDVREQLLAQQLEPAVSPIIFTGLPSIEAAMTYSATGLSWVQNSYTSSSVVCCDRELAYAGHSLQSWR